jgi:hypothetical protein
MRTGGGFDHDWKSLCRARSEAVLNNFEIASGCGVAAVLLNSDDNVATIRRYLRTCRTLVADQVHTSFSFAWRLNPGHQAGWGWPPVGVATWPCSGLLQTADCR